MSKELESLHKGVTDKKIILEEYPLLVAVNDNETAVYLIVLYRPKLKETTYWETLIKWDCGHLDNPIINISDSDKGLNDQFIFPNPCHLNQMERYAKTVAMSLFLIGDECDTGNVSIPQYIQDLSRINELIRKEDIEFIEEMIEPFYKMSVLSNGRWSNLDIGVETFVEGCTESRDIFTGAEMERFYEGSKKVNDTKSPSDYDDVRIIKFTTRLKMTDGLVTATFEGRYINAKEGQKFHSGYISLMEDWYDYKFAYSKQSDALFSAIIGCASDILGIFFYGKHNKSDRPEASIEGTLVSRGEVYLKICKDIIVNGIGFDVVGPPVSINEFKQRDKQRLDGYCCDSFLDSVRDGRILPVIKHYATFLHECPYCKVGLIDAWHIPENSDKAPEWEGHDLNFVLSLFNNKGEHNEN
ncbi:MAG: hypothetical protein GY928_34160 [Colwellia sp.]|nr:hypothetical protein [Colwellia sp.]